jgi:hypothetical protein
MLQRNMRLCRTKEQRQAMLTLGGAECKSAADFTKDQYAYIPISFFASPSADGISLPLSADLLSQQVQITAEIAPATSFWKLNILPPAAAPVLAFNLPSAFTVANFQVEQLVMKDRGMSAANSEALMTGSYNMPLPEFDQQEVLIPVPSTAGPLGPGVSQPLVLTGFRAGEVKKLQIWLTKNDDPLNATLWYKPSSVEVLYAGVIYAKYDNGSSAMWNLLDGTAPSAIDQSVLTPGGAAVMTSVGAVSEWVELPFAQPTGNDYDGQVLVSGLAVTNGIVNLQLTPPTNEAYTLHVLYSYNCTASFSRGSCELIF